MLVKLLVVTSCVAVLTYGAPQYNNQYDGSLDPYHKYNGYDGSYQSNNHQDAQYEFGYEVNDQSTGDVKSHQESRKNGVVTGRYEVIDPDGYKRIVEYTADAIHGFNARVRRIPLTDYRAPAPAFVHNVPVYSTVAPAIHSGAYHHSTVAPAIHGGGYHHSTVAPITAGHAVLASTVAPFLSTTVAPSHAHPGFVPQVPHSAVYVATHTAPSVDLQAPSYNPTAHGYSVQPTGFAYDRQYDRGYDRQYYQ